MELKLSNGRTLHRPGPSHIEMALKTAGSGNGFVVLSRDALNYIQAAGDTTNGFHLEYQSGSLEKHYRSTKSDIPLETVVEIFEAYAAKDQLWWHLTTWKKHQLMARVGRCAEKMAVTGWLLMLIYSVCLWLFEGETEKITQKLNMTGLEVLVYVWTVGYLLNYPSARKIIKKDLEPRDWIWAGARTTVIAAPVLSLVSIFMLARHIWAIITA